MFAHEYKCSPRRSAGAYALAFVLQVFRVICDFNSHVWVGGDFIQSQRTQLETKQILCQKRRSQLKNSKNRSELVVFPTSNRRKGAALARCRTGIRVRRSDSVKKKIERAVILGDINDINAHETGWAGGVLSLRRVVVWALVRCLEIADSGQFSGRQAGCVLWFNIKEIHGYVLKSFKSRKNWIVREKK